MRDTADELDIAFQQSEMFLKSALANVSPGQKLSPRGYCYNPACEEDVGSGKIFCNSSCAHEYERYRKIGKI